MIQQLTDYLQGFNWSKFFIGILLISVFVAGLVLYESHTQNIVLERSKLAIELAQSAEEYRDSIQSQLSPRQESIYNGVLQASDESLNISKNTIKLQHSTMKFLAGLLPWLLMAFVYIGDKSRGSFVGMFGSVIFGIAFAGILALIPNIMWPWFNLAVLPVIPFFMIMFFFARKFRKNANP